jgi:hypothetical protein
MKTLFLTIVAPVLLVTLGFGQTPAPTSTDQARIKGCLGGSDGNYTVAEDGTTQTFIVASSTVDLKPHVGHDIEVTGQKAATDSGPSDNSVAITAVNMISEQCAPATTSASPAPASAPPVADATPAATTSAPVIADSTPVATTATPAADDAAPVAAVSTPVAADPAPVAVVSTAAAADPTPTVAASAPAQTLSEPDDSKQLPNTATSLPLVALLGLGLLGLGLWSRKSCTR